MLPLAIVPTRARSIAWSTAQPERSVALAAVHAVVHAQAYGRQPAHGRPSCPARSLADVRLT
jgi:hypothetical protein